MTTTHGGSIIAEVLSRHGVPFVYTLCGGHISPILTGAKERGIKVVDCRDERNAVFAADATARMTGRPGVAAVTAGPGVTNAMTALKNAQMAQTPLVLFGGATATILKGRGSLQDIDQLSLMRPATKWATRVTTVGELGPTVEKAFVVAKSGVPGPVFIEVPVDLLYPEEIVREWYLKEAGVENPTNLTQRALALYLRGHLYRQFHMPHVSLELPMPGLDLPKKVVTDSQIGKVAAALRSAKRPALVVGNQTMVGCSEPGPLADAIETLGMPTWLGGSARGLLGRSSEIQFLHKRGKALRDADLVIVLGFPFDFRLKYGLSISQKATLVSVNLSAEELKKNRRPDIAVQMNASDFIIGLAREVGGPDGRWDDWIGAAREREEKRDAEIRGQAGPGGDGLVDPIHFFMRLEKKMADDAIIVADGGDFVATGAYILRPRGPLSWLDPGVFGTLGVGGGFAVGASYVRPGAEVWIIWGDGSCAYSINEFDTYARHGLAPIAVVGTDASWAQIARDQSVILGDDVATTLLRTPYHTVAEGYGGKGLLLTEPEKIDETLAEAKAIAREGKPVLINVHLAPSDFRKGSISI